MEENGVIGEVLEVDVSKISMNPYQPRRNFSETELAELALSIQTIGLIHPPVVRLLQSGCYELVSGERRFRAIQLAGLRKISVIVRSSTASLSAQAALIENIQRVDLNPMEIASGLNRLIQEFGFSQEHIAQKLGKKRSTIANYLRLLALPQKIQQSLESGLITMGHAKGLLSLQDEKHQEVLHEKILLQGLNVRETETLAQRFLKKKGEHKKVLAKDIHLEKLADLLREKLGTKVKIQGKNDKGRLSIDFYSLDDLDRLLHLFGIEEL